MFTEKQSNLVVNREKRAIGNIAIISEGQTLNGYSIDAVTLSGIFKLAQNQTGFSVYLDHESPGINSHKPNDAIGVINALFIDSESKTLRGTLTFFASFAKDEPAKFERLLEIAETAPDTCGLSIHSTGHMVTVDEATNEETPATKNDKPEETFLRVDKLLSIDWVSHPAATHSLSISTQDKPTTDNLLMTPEELTAKFEELTAQLTKHAETIAALESRLVALEPKKEETEEQEKPALEVQVEDEEKKALSLKVKELETKLVKLSAGAPTIDLGIEEEKKVLSVKEQYQELSKKGDFKAALKFYNEHKNEIR